MLGLLAACGPPLRPMIIPVPPPEPTDIATPAPRPSPDEATALYGRSLMVPVDGIFPTALRDNYGAARGARQHAAIDIMAPRGALVVAADSGRIWKIRSNNLGGLTLYLIDPAERFVYYYAHLDRYADGIREGQGVAPGDVLGHVGTTGNAPPNAPHLHFQILRYRGNGRWWDGDPLNPFPFLLQPGKANRR
jgi:murein DD-endopeptidase MepM/ murein hydrolase activator NlpD